VKGHQAQDNKKGKRSRKKKKDNSGAGLSSEKGEGERRANFAICVISRRKRKTLKNLQMRTPRPRRNSETSILAWGRKTWRRVVTQEKRGKGTEMEKEMLFSVV